VAAKPGAKEITLSIIHFVTHIPLSLMRKPIQGDGRMSDPTNVRQPIARQFYPGNCRKQLDEFVSDHRPPAGLPPILHGAALPHAGWQYAGRIAVHTLACFHTGPAPATVVIFGTPHYLVREHALYPHGQWKTPLGNLRVDEASGAALLDAASDLLQASVEAHRHEHSIEVLTPMIKYFFPAAAILPILVLPDESAPVLGRLAGKTMARLGQPTVFLASSDLTHYGLEYGHAPVGEGPEAQAWMRRQDMRLIHALCHGSAEDVLNEALAQRSACGPGALAALKAAVAEVGAPQGQLIRYATSFDIEHQTVFRRAVGYAGVVF